MMDEILIETRLTEWAAGVLKLTVDAGIYRGGLLPAVRSGVAVMLHEEVKDNTVRPATYNVQILGKFCGDDARDDALRMRAALSAAVPCYGVELEGVMFAAILPRGGGEPYRAEDGGAVATYMSINLLVSALTTQA
ncbi:hypothetical protein [Victivallis lenta]|uniref:hypothetical protein n=1 Tax=Victivallis lenta TaxID=2606640 RepID=UPI003AF24650